MTRGHRADTRQVILDVAAELFATQGFGDTPMRQISDAVGVTKAALYYHFAAKETILLALVVPLQTAVEELLDRLELTPPSAGRVLADYLSILVRFGGTTRMLARDPSVLTHPQIGPPFFSSQARLRGVLADAVGDDDTANIRASCAMGALQAGLLQVPDVPGEDDLDVLVDAALATMRTSGASSPPAYMT